MRNYLFTSESVTEGHPDKVCDIISDAILDEILKQDKDSRVACETMITTAQVIVSAEITTKATIDYHKIINKTLEQIGYSPEDLGATKQDEFGDKKVLINQVGCFGLYLGRIDFLFDTNNNKIFNTNLLMI